MVTGHYPTSLKEALALLEAHPGALLISGGTDVMVVKKEADHVIFLNQIEELKQVEGGEETEEAVSGKAVLRIGAGVTYVHLLAHPLIPEVLKQAISGIASPAIRNIGTMAGNICNASPAGDTLPVLYALDAKVVIQGNELGKMYTRKVPIEAFIQGIRKIALKPTELVAAIEIPVDAYKKMNRCAYEKVGARKSEAISKLSFIGLANIEEDVVSDIKIAFGSVSITVVRRRGLEEQLIGKKVSALKAEKEEILKAYAEFITPIDDQRSTATYRKTVCINLLRDFLENL